MAEISYSDRIQFEIGIIQFVNLFPGPERGAVLAQLKERLRLYIAECSALPYSLLEFVENGCTR